MLKVRLKEVLSERPEWTQKRLSEATGIQTTTIYEIANNIRSAINRAHISKIAQALDIKDMNELFYIELEE